MFDMAYEKFTITNKIRLIELFGGVGSQAMALRNIGADFEHHRLVEWDKYAMLAYNAVHGTDFTTSDITKVKGEDLGITDTEEYTYIMTYSFPCQDLSLAGKRQGMSKGDKTRSGLLWEVERLLTETKELPQVLLMENVPQVIGKGNINDFREWQYFLESLGYMNYTQVLNAKHYGVAQNRERCFMVSILGEYSYNFPEPIKLTKTIADYLEDEVEEKFYIKGEKADKLIEQLIEKGQLGTDKVYADGTINDPEAKEISNCLTAKDRGIRKFKSEGGVVVHGSIYTDNSPEFFRGMQEDGTARTLKSNSHDAGVVMQVGNIVDTGNLDNPQRGRIYSCEGVSPSLNTVGGGGLEPKVLLEPQIKKIGNYMESEHSASVVVDVSGIAPTVRENHGTVTGIAEPIKGKQATKQGYIECKPGGVADLSYPTSTLRRGRVQSGGDISPTITTGEPAIHRLESPYRIRKLTPKECWRLMAFTDEDFHKAEKVVSNSQLYKIAGNSIAVKVLEGIFKEMME